MVPRRAPVGAHGFLPIVFVLLGCVLAPVSGSAASPHPAAHRAAHEDATAALQRYLALDLGFVGDLGSAAAARFDVVEQELARCPGAPDDREKWIACALTTLLRPGGPPTPPGRAGAAAHTVTHVLAEGRGSCAAVVAAILALAGAESADLDALVLRDHVLLGLRGVEDRFFEPLQPGRTLSLETALRQYAAPPGGPERVSPADFVGYYLDNLAARLTDDRRLDDAEAAFREAERRLPRSGRIQFNYGTLLLRLGRHAEAERRLDRAIRLGWSDASAQVNRGVALRRLGKIRAARRCFEKALRLDPGNREATENLQALVAPLAAP